jgi:hypothetical protein
MPHRDCVIGIFPDLATAQETIAELKRRGWRSSELSVVARGNESELDATRPLDQGDQMEKGAALGAATGAALGLLASSALLIVPGIGPVIFAGAMASGITGGLVGGIVGAMSGWGVKEDHAREYESDLRNGKALLLVAGDPLRLAEAQALLEDSPAEEVTLHAETADSKVDS